MADQEKPPSKSKPLSAWTKAQTIGAPKVGVRYTLPTWDEIVGSENPLRGLADWIVGPGRPRTVQAQDPYGITAWEQGTGPVPMLMGTTEGVGNEALDLSHRARMQRAAEQGYVIDAYRGAKAHNEEIKIPAWFAGPEDANVYSGSVNPTARLFGEANVPAPPFQRGSQVQPVKLRVQNPKKVSFTEIAFPTPESLAQVKAEGFDGLMYESPNGPWYVPLDLAQIRSRFAKFDPAKIGSKDLLAGIAGGVSLSQLGRSQRPETR